MMIDGLSASLAGCEILIDLISKNSYLKDNRKILVKLFLKENKFEIPDFIIVGNDIAEIPSMHVIEKIDECTDDKKFIKEWKMIEKKLNKGIEEKKKILIKKMNEINNKHLFNDIESM